MQNFICKTLVFFVKFNFTNFDCETEMYILQTKFTIYKHCKHCETGPSLEERGTSLTDPQPSPTLALPRRMKQTSANVFLYVAKYMEVRRGKMRALRRMSKCFPVKSLKLIPHQIGNMGTGVIMQKMIQSDSIPLHFDFMTRRSTLSHKKRT